jgi:branched-chain amino acid transport system substrate-binding protein
MEMLLRMGSLLLGAILALAAPASAQEQAPGVSATKIKLGNTAPYSGPASSYGTIARSAIAYFEMVNDKGGIHGRKVEVISLDDSYSPPKAVEQTRKLVEDEEVFAIFMPLGSPTSAATQSYLNQKKVPQIFVTSGAERWNQPEKFPWSIGWNVEYATEGRIYARYILDNIKDPRIAVLYQNDDFGKAVLSGLKDGLGERSNAIVDAVSYELSDPTVDSPIARLKNTGATVFLSLTTPKFAAQSIRAVDNLGWKPLIILPSVSNSIDPVLTGAGLERSVGIISSSYTKQPSDPQWRDAPDFKAWTAFMDKYYPSGSKTDWLNAYGYGMAYAMHQALEMAGPQLTREALMNALHSIRNMEVPMLLPGITISISKTDHGPSSRCRSCVSTAPPGKPPGRSSQGNDRPDRAASDGDD